ncbi:MAG: hypothetical protein WC755_00675 [Candidatus Woesearchaeota archaeon]|jgi:hypothetical protein
MKTNNLDVKHDCIFPQNNYANLMEQIRRMKDTPTGDIPYFNNSQIGQSTNPMSDYQRLRFQRNRGSN